MAPQLTQTNRLLPAELASYLASVPQDSAYAVGIRALIGLLGGDLDAGNVTAGQMAAALAIVTGTGFPDVFLAGTPAAPVETPGDGEFHSVLEFTVNPFAWSVVDVIVMAGAADEGATLDALQFEFDPAPAQYGAFSKPLDPIQRQQRIPALWTSVDQGPLTVSLMVKATTSDGTPATIAATVALMAANGPVDD